MTSFLACLFVSLYLHIALRLGFHRHVYRLASNWGGDSMRKPIRYNAAAGIQHYLSSYGYYFCPSCTWVTEQPNEHIQVEGSWCQEQAQPKCECHGWPLEQCQATEQYFAEKDAEMEAEMEAEEAGFQAFLVEEERRTQSEWEEAEQYYASLKLSPYDPTTFNVPEAEWISLEEDCEESDDPANEISL